MQRAARELGMEQLPSGEKPGGPWHYQRVAPLAPPDAIAITKASLKRARKRAAWAAFVAQRDGAR